MKENKLAKEMIWLWNEHLMTWLSKMRSMEKSKKPKRDVTGYRSIQAYLVWEQFSQHYEISYSTHKTVLKTLQFASSFRINKHDNLYFPYSTDVCRGGPGGRDRTLVVKRRKNA